MSWLSDIGNKLGIRIDSHTLGNLVKNASPAAALIPGVGPLAAAALAAGGSAAGDALRGHSVDLGSVLTNAGLGYGLGTSGLAGDSTRPGWLRGASSGAVPTGPAAGPSPTAGASAVTPPIPGAPTAATAAVPPAPPANPGFLTKAGNFLNSPAGVATGYGLKGLGDLASAPAANRLTAANTALTESKVKDSEEERKRRAELDALLASVSATPGVTVPTVRPNPYGSQLSLAPAGA